MKGFIELKEYGKENNRSRCYREQVGTWKNMKLLSIMKHLING